MNDFQKWMANCCQRVDLALDQSIPCNELQPQVFHEAMRYVTLGGGKRIRAALVYASAEAVSSQLNQHSLDAGAQAVELIHAYSLVHDDLPCMDNDELRRGKPSAHIKYGYANALLVGDALQSLAFEVLAKQNHAADIALNMVACLSNAAGAVGMCGGQWIDMNNQVIDSLQDLQLMHHKKTGALIQASVELGALSAGATQAQKEALLAYAHAVGLAFQIVDDVLDVTATTQALGKTSGKDKKSDKITYVSALGLDSARDFANTLYKEARDHLSLFGERAIYLDDLAKFVINRTS